MNGRPRGGPFGGGFEGASKGPFWLGGGFGDGPGEIPVALRAWSMARWCREMAVAS